MRAGEESGDILSEEARLHEMEYPLHMMHTLYYEGSGDYPEKLRPCIAALVAAVHPVMESTVRIYEHEN